MSYDVAFRFRQALEPSALTTIAGCFHAVTAAISDCRNAGKPFEADPAVLLLSQFLGDVARAQAPDQARLRQRCLGEIAELKGKPALRTLCQCGIDGDPTAKKLFHPEGRKALRLLAGVLGYAEGDYDIRSNPGGPAVAGEITLHSNEIDIQLGIREWGNDVLYRTCKGRRDFSGGRNRWADVADLLAPDTFAERLRHECGPTVVAPVRERMFA